MMFDVSDAENIPVSNYGKIFCRHKETAMTASKPEVVIIQELNDIAEVFKRLPLHFRTRQTHWSCFRHCPTSADNRK